MNGNPHYIHVDNKNKDILQVPVSKNRLCYSELTSVHVKNVVRNYSIKYTLEGCEYYNINNKEYKVHEGYFLTACAPSNGSAYFDSKTVVKGICIDIDYQSISEAYTLLASKGKIDLDNNLDGYFRSPFFFENLIPAGASELGKVLTKIGNTLLGNPSAGWTINQELFLQLTEEVLKNEFENFKSISSITSSRPGTRKEIYRRVLLGKFFIDGNFTRKIEVDEIARNAFMSEFHFFRSFKEAFGITPHQYILARRLTKSHEELTHSKKIMSEIAVDCGFSDIYSFSKSFKKFFGYSPSLLTKRTSQDLTN